MVGISRSFTDGFSPHDKSDGPGRTVQESCTCSFLSSDTTYEAAGLYFHEKILQFIGSQSRLSDK